MNLALGIALVCSVCLLLAADQPPAEPAPATEPWRVLIYSRTLGYRHASIEPGIAAIRTLGEAHGFAVEATEDPAAFTDDHLARFDAIIFLSTSGDVLDEPGEHAFERYIRAGGGFVGIHAATDTEFDWPWYNRLVGGYFAHHPKIQPAEIDVLDHDHTSTAHLPDRWKRTDEWYNFRDLNADVHVLLNLDESTYEGGTMGEHHPIAWYHAFDGGRAWYTAGGHTSESFAEEAFLKHLLGGITWAAGR